jgi:hypothetical protein
MGMSEPASAAVVWRRFWAWVLGVPLAVAGAGLVVWAALWVSGGEMAWQAWSDMGTTVLWLAAIVLMYPLLVWMWIGDLRAGLKAAADWEELSEAERAAARAAPAPRGTSRRRKAGGGA